jgi:hypothetical protein
MALGNNRRFVKLKYKNKLEQLTMIHPLLLMILADMAWWCAKRNIDFVLTDLLSSLKRDKKLGRTSNSHRTARAADLRSRTFTDEQKEQFEDYFNDKYAYLASISRSDLVPRLVVLHGEGDNEHFHIAIHSKFSLKIF